MEKYYSFAGVDIAVEISDEQMYLEDRILEPFRVVNADKPHRFQFKRVRTLTAPLGRCIAIEPGFRVYQEKDCLVRYIGAVKQSWEPAYIRAAHRGREHEVQLLDAQLPERIGTKTVLNSIAAEHLIAQAGGLLLHASYIEWQGGGILFTAPSGIGKSTQAALWESMRGADIINGDRAGVRAIDDEVVACGVPFSGSSQICKNRTLPLSAIVYLKQAPQTSIRRLRGSQAFRCIWEGCSVNTWDRIDVESVSETVLRVISAVPVFELACTPDESAIIALEGVLSE